MFGIISGTASFTQKDADLAFAAVLSPDDESPPGTPEMFTQGSVLDAPGGVRPIGGEADEVQDWDSD